MTAAAKAVWDWTCDPDHHWRSWVAHTVLLILMAAPFGVLPAVFFYAAREAEQALVKKIEGKPQDVRDNMLDIVVPMVAAAPLFMLLGWR